MSLPSHFAIFEKPVCFKSFVHHVLKSDFLFFFPVYYNFSLVLMGYVEAGRLFLSSLGKPYSTRKPRGPSGAQRGCKGFWKAPRGGSVRLWEPEGSRNVWGAREALDLQSTCCLLHILVSKSRQVCRARSAVYVER